MRQTLRPARWLVIAVIASAVLVSIGAVWMYRIGGWSSTSVTLTLLCLISAGALVELAILRVSFSREVMKVVHLWSVRSLRRDDIRSVIWESGAGVSLKLANGEWFKLPELGLNSQGVANTLRAWLKRP